MGIILGYLCVICFVLLAVKAITRHFRLTKIDRILMKIHKPLSALIILLGVAHFIVVISVMENRAMLVNISGVMIIAAIFVLTYLCHVIKNREKRILWHRIMTVILFIGLMVHIVAYFIDFNQYQQKIANIEVEEIDLSKVEDGVYEGDYDAGYIYAKVRVQIKAGKIASVTLLEHRNEHGKPAEAIIDDVLKKQQIDVDAVSGATNSSKVIQKAIEDAIP